MIRWLLVYGCLLLLLQKFNRDMAAVRAETALAQERIDEINEQATGLVLAIERVSQSIETKLGELE